MTRERARKESPHGTAARARMHYRDGEKPCRDCQQAENRRGADYRARDRKRYNRLNNEWRQRQRLSA